MGAPKPTILMTPLLSPLFCCLLCILLYEPFNDDGLQGVSKHISKNEDKSLEIICCCCIMLIGLNTGLVCFSGLNTKYKNLFCNT